MNVWELFRLYGLQLALIGHCKGWDDWDLHADEVEGQVVLAGGAAELQGLALLYDVFVMQLN